MVATEMIIPPGVLKGTIKIPGSKSMMQRAVAATMLSGSKCILHSPSFSADGLASLGIASSFGSAWDTIDGNVVLHGKFAPPLEGIYCGESGLSLRMFVPIAALQNSLIEMQGSGSLTKRPIDMLQTPLLQLGASIQTHNGFLPVLVKGPLKGGFAEVDGSVSSQILTGLLMALPLAPENSTLKVHKLQSVPYIDMTLKLLADWGIKIEHEDYCIFHIAGNQTYTSPDNYLIEGDWSSASFWLAAAAINGDICISGLDENSKQADKSMIEALRKAQVNVSTNEEGIHIKKSAIQAFDFDATHCPDLFPPLVALAAYGNGISTIHGVQRLTHKESNRSLALQEVFGTLGIKIETDQNTMKVHGGSLRGGSISSHNDHRIAMAAAVAAIGAHGSVSIHNAQCVEKSYPEFFEHLRLLQ